MWYGAAEPSSCPSEGRLVAAGEGERLGAGAGTQGQRLCPLAYPWVLVTWLCARCVTALNKNALII